MSKNKKEEKTKLRLLSNPSWPYGHIAKVPPTQLTCMTLGARSRSALACIALEAQHPTLPFCIRWNTGN